MFGSLFKKTPPPTLEDQLSMLVSCGIQLDPRATPATLRAMWSEEKYSADPYGLLLVALGGEERLAANFWHFDTECIEDHGAYVAIAQRMSAMAGGGLALTKIEDFVDVDAEEAWLSFDFDGEQYKWDCEVKDDWVDPTVLSEFAALLDSQNTPRRFVYLDLEGQDCLIGCLTSDELSRIRKVTGLNFEWLK